MGALRSAGVEVDSIYDLVNTAASYSAVIPLLIQLLPTLRERRIREGVVRAAPLHGKSSFPPPACLK